MRQRLYDPKAKKQTVSLTINADLVAKLKSAGVNASQVAEDALADALAKRTDAACEAGRAAHAP